MNTKLIRLDIYDTKRDLLRYNGTVFSIAEWLSRQQDGKSSRRSPGLLLDVKASETR